MVGQGLHVLGMIRELACEWLCFQPVAFLMVAAEWPWAWPILSSALTWSWVVGRSWAFVAWMVEAC